MGRNAGARGEYALTASDTVSLVCPFLKKRHIRVFSKRLAYFTPVLLVQFLFSIYTSTVLFPSLIQLQSAIERLEY
jgi:hypothetical protein